jgi:hypothetical protein
MQGTEAPHSAPNQQYCPLLNVSNNWAKDVTSRPPHNPSLFRFPAEQARLL